VAANPERPLKGRPEERARLRLLRKRVRALRTRLEGADSREERRLLREELRAARATLRQVREETTGLTAAEIDTLSETGAPSPPLQQAAPGLVAAETMGAVDAESQELFPLEGARPAGLELTPAERQAEGEARDPRQAREARRGGVYRTRYSPDQVGNVIATALRRIGGEADEELV
jgi:hypothetical protein